MDKSRFLALDGLRGIAAIFVLMAHTESMWGFKVAKAYLGVDLFFLLSGFVIAHAYGARLANGTLSFIGFLKVRVLRLYPVYLLSLVAAAGAWTLFRDDTSQLGWLMATGILFLPLGLPGSASLYVLNGPYWSLFYELVANGLYALIHRLLTRWVLVALLLLCGLALVVAALKMGSLNAGNLRNNGHLFTGVVRAHFGFFLGILFYKTREQWMPLLPRLPFWIPALGLMAVFVIPRDTSWNAAIDVLAVAVVIPLLVMLATISNLPVRAHGWVALLGAASYPMYVMHIPIRQFLAYGVGGKEALAAMAPVIGVAYLLLVFVVSVLIERRLDEPFRRWVQRRFRSKPLPAAAAP